MIKKIVYNRYIYLFIYSVLFTIISYYSANMSSIIYDYPFHLGRIVGLAQSIRNYDFLPSLNYVFLKGSGYGVPMFYGNWVLYLPAIVFIKTKVATLSFAVLVWQSTFATVCTTYFTLEKMTGRWLHSFCGAIAISCSVTYFGFGMTAVVPLIPLLLYSIYKVIYKDECNPILLAIVISLLVQTHIISTVVLAIFALVLVLLNIDLLSFKKIKSFIYSVLISILLLSGFIVQYLEQNASQIFFVNWKLRDHPFPSGALMAPGSILSILSNYYWPIIYVFILLAIFSIRKLDRFSKQLVFATVLMFIFSSNILPWHLLRESFLSVFQYTERLIYLLPVFVIFALAKSASKNIVILATVLQFLIYIYAFPMRFTIDGIPYSERGYTSTTREIIFNTNQDALNAYNNPLTYQYDTSGDEYLNIDVNHENIRNGVINNFEFDGDSVEVTNIRHGYNLLEFDVKLASEGEEQLIVLPRIWYEGYIAEYLEGANGSQPQIFYVEKTPEEIHADLQVGKPENNKKALYDGRATLKISSSGHVSVYFAKTTLQKIGFTVESISFVCLFCYLVVCKILEKLNEKTIGRRSMF
ncbi:hypothetical protein J5571_06700 [Streptococcus suis]|uniref:hypothetical protein n=2 Tax=Streptococcus suis TaxID=1307 RepID=UPI000C1748EC|nr:hypothetical protein [Streptococcus suis]MBL6504617.1 hypothetical protein [Streptococcus suis]MBM0240869.1 hypothetical protein [Streptococcus suis]MBM7204204.1 hypothetical protein [Streptococcus suis]MBM7281187.1 hypothetical protein [Streptococcus suis]MBO4116225.1 hypothetical protein [Streptococcus suis]